MTRESVFVQPTPDGGHMMLIVLEVEDKQKLFASFANPKSEFEKWTQSWAEEVHGMKPDGDMPPLPDAAFEWSA